MASIPETRDLVKGILRCDRTALARAITLIESSHTDHKDAATELLAMLEPYAGGAMRVGVTGVPGVGKSTFIETIGLQLVETGHRVAVLAIDPSSSVSGGSVLGDKTRMERLSALDAAFIRPSPTSGALGGVGRRTYESMIVCEAAGFDVVLVETVGVGQSEIDVGGLVDFFLVLLLAGAGDELQGIKRGILELADLWIVNKADGPQREAVERARSEYERVLAMYRTSDTSGLGPKIFSCSAIEGTGIEEILAELRTRFSTLTQTGRLEARRKRQKVDRVWASVEDELFRSVRQHQGVRQKWQSLREDVIAGNVNVPKAARILLSVYYSESPSSPLRTNGGAASQQEPKEERAAEEGGDHTDG
ncbi:MAG: methylmalonyl Co-A mutase-associated GTPase MeaB [bacterium]|nr:methylmalonyl Co-A mutase-associated GTPase MeaB [bacterium]